LADDAIKSHAAELCTTCPPLGQGNHLILAVEDARILAGKIERVDQLYALGVRILTLMWRDDTCIGGSHNTESGLTDFGKAALRRALELGIVPDISHASVASAADTFAIAKEMHRPVIASHSNAYAICPVERNLRDEQIKQIIESDGIIGINLFPAFIKEGKDISSEELFPHIDHFLSMGAEEHLCLGGDMDGAPLPKDMSSLSSYTQLAQKMLAHGYSENFMHKLFFGNAYRFASTYLA
jgi:membrane dipeptidase